MDEREESIRWETDEGDVGKIEKKRNKVRQSKEGMGGGDKRKTNAMELKSTGKTICTF